MIAIRNKFHICDLFGIPIYLDLSFGILLFIFLTGGHSLPAGLSMALALALSVILHELGHSLTARVFGYRTTDITLSLLGGCASMISLPRKGWQEFLTAIAGPAVSFSIAAAAAVVLGLVGEGHPFSLLLQCLFSGSVRYAEIGKTVVFFGSGDPIFGCSPGVFWVVNALLDLGCLNLMLGAFNMLPGFPLDGGRVFRSLMRGFMTRAKATYVAMVVGRGVAVLLAVKGVWNLFSKTGSWGFVTILIAWMIWKEGYREYLMARQEENFRNWTQADFDARVSPPPYDR